MGELIGGGGLGFRVGTEDDPPGWASMEEAALESAREVFPPEFLNRLDETLVYGTLAREDLERIFDKFLAQIHRRALDSGTPPVVDVSPGARAHLIDEGTDLRFGARPLRRSVERRLVGPLSRLLAAGALGPGDVVEVEVKGGELAFFRVGRQRGGRL